MAYDGLWLLAVSTPQACLQGHDQVGRRDFLAEMIAPCIFNSWAASRLTDETLNLSKY
jgi:hypothetical protein